MTSLKHRLSICLLLLLPLALACGEDSPVGSTPGPGTKGPKVLSITPANGANNVPTNTSVVITFSDMMESTTLADTVLFLTPNRGSRVSVRGDVVTLELPILAPATDYTVTVTTAAADTSGNHLAAQFTSMFSTAGAVNATPQFVHKWGVIGSANGEFIAPAGVAVDGSGNVYVADFINNRIQKFSSTGTFITTWGSVGTGIGQFNLPVDLAVDGSGNVYVVEQINHRVQKFDNLGNHITMWGSQGTGTTQFDFPVGIAADGSGNVYVADQGNHRIQKFSSTGTFVTAWGKPGGSFGSGDGEFNLPSGVAVDAGGNVYVADSQNHRIQKFGPTGTFLAKVGTQGTADGQLNFPWGVAVDASGNIYVAESDNNRCQKFDATMTFVAKWGSLGSGDGQFKDPQGIAVNGSGDIYVADTDNSRIQQFK
jgi:DNA-binding beta-propeller fold protein YncE